MSCHRKFHDVIQAVIHYKEKQNQLYIRIFKFDIIYRLVIVIIYQ